MVTSGILVSITTREPRGGLLVTFSPLLLVYGTIAIWLYVEQLDTEGKSYRQLTIEEPFYYVQVFIAITTPAFTCFFNREFFVVTYASVWV